MTGRPSILMDSESSSFMKGNKTEMNDLKTNQDLIVIQGQKQPKSYGMKNQ